MAFNVVGQTNVNPNYSAPYFQGNVKIADTLGVDTLYTSNSRMVIVDSISLLSDLSGVSYLNVDTLEASASDTIYNPSVLTDDVIIAVLNTDIQHTIVISTEDIQSGSILKYREMTIHDKSGLAGTNNIIVKLETGGNINGVSTLTINGNYDSVTIGLDGTNGYVIR